MKKICTLCAALLVTLSLAACASGPNAAEQVIGTEGTVAMEDLTPSSDADKEAIGYQLEAPEAGEEICVLKTNYGDIKLRFFPDVHLQNSFFMLHQIPGRSGFPISFRFFYSFF